MADRTSLESPALPRETSFMVKWSILTLTMPTRTMFLARLKDALEPQLVNGVEWKILMCDPQYTLGENRNMLVSESQAEYVSALDDDDLPSGDYVETIFPLLDGVDYIGHNLQCYIDGEPLPNVTHHSLKYSGWYENDSGYFRDISHVNPALRDLVILESFNGGHGEDQRWADRMRKRDVLKTENYIQKTLYHYYFRTRKNIGNPCPKCQSDSTVLLEDCTWCNGCGFSFDGVPKRRSCLWV